jgi:hypothetical protein
MDWDEIFILYLSCVIVYSDKILERLSSKTSKRLGWWHLIWIESAAIGLLVLAMYVMIPIYQKLVWWEPLYYVGLLAVIRIMIDFSDWWFKGFRP